MYTHFYDGVYHESEKKPPLRFDILYLHTIYVRVSCVRTARDFPEQENAHWSNNYLVIHRANELFPLADRHLLKYIYITSTSPR